MSFLRAPDGRSTLSVSLTGKCRVCGEVFTKRTSTHVVCSLSCAKKIPVIARNTVKAQAKEERQDIAKRKEAIKTRSDWHTEAQAEINRYARLRDIRLGHGCITCGAEFGNKFGGAFDAGHMHSRGSNPHLRFHLHNIALQCVKDNRYLGGLAIRFRVAMVERIGVEKVEALEAIRGPAKFSIDYLKRLKRVFAKKANRMEKRIEHEQG